MRYRSILVIWAASVLICFPGFTAEYHVAAGSPGSSDANPGTSQRPWKSLAKAAAASRPGDTVLIHAGTYKESVVIGTQGSSLNPTRFAAFGDDEVVLEGADPVPLNKWEVVRNLQHVFQFPLSQDPGFVVVDGRVVNVKLDQLSRRYPRSYRRGVLKDSDRMAYQYDETAKRLLLNLGGNLPGNHEISVPTRTTAFVVGNRCSLSGVRVQHYSGAGIQIIGSDAVVSDCLVRDSGHGITISGWDQRGSIVQRNTVRDILGNGILLLDRPKQCVVEDNLVARCTLNPGHTTDWLGSVKVNSGSDCIFAHNVVLDSGNPETDEGHDGCGLWGDINISRVGYVGNTSAYNKAGLYVEYAMGDTRAYFNTIYRNAMGITCRQSQRGVFMRNILVENRTTGFALWPGDAPYPTADHLFCHNLVRDCVPAIYIQSEDPNFSDYNTYWTGTNLLAQTATGAGGAPRLYYQLSDWARATGHDSHSEVRDSSPADLGLETVTFRVPGLTNSSDVLMMIGNGGFEYEDPVGQTILPYFWHPGSGDGLEHGFMYATYCGLEGGVDTVAYANSGGTLSLYGDAPQTDASAPKLAHSGTRSLLISGLKPNQMCAQGLGCWTPSLPAKPGDVFKLTFFVRGQAMVPSGAEAIIALAEFTNETGQHRRRVNQATTPPGKTLSGTFDWVEFTSNITVPQDSARMKVFLGMAPGKGKLLIDDVSLKVQ